jgi:hypothetical protein
MLKALGSVRRLRAKISAFRALEPPELPRALAFAEEYASAVIDEQLADLAVMIEELPKLRDGHGTAARLRIRLSHTIEQVNRVGWTRALPPHGTTRPSTLAIASACSKTSWSGRFISTRGSWRATRFIATAQRWWRRVWRRRGPRWRRFRF